jgi:NADPH2:quinone reductase
MKRLVEFPSESGEPIMVEVEDLELAGGGGPTRRGISPSGVVDRAQTSFEDALEKAQPMSSGLVSKLRSIADSPDEVQVEFGLSLSAQAGAVLVAGARTGAGATWTRCWYSRKDRSMRAIAIEGFGGRDRLKLVELPTPEPGPDEVLVRVRAAGVGPWDTKTRKGLFGERSFPHVLGVEASGIVESAGENVADLRGGDEVYVYSGGCYAEYVAAPAQKVARRPASLSFEEAAGAPVAGSTAYQGIVEEIGLKEGETVLIAGAAGGVGTMAVQIAASLGARVLSTASPRNHAYLRSLGAAEAIDYHGDWVAAVRTIALDGVDAVFDCVGGETFRRSFEAVRDGARVVTIVAFGEKIEPGRGITHHAFSARAERRKLEKLSEMFDAGKLRVEVEDVLPLEEAAKAHERVEAGHTRGKIVLRVG